MRVTKSFSESEFTDIAKRDVGDFSDFGEVVSEGKLDGDTYVYKDNGSDVLGVAHLDTVQGSKRSSMLRVGKERVLVCPVLDDRLGVYIITRMLPKLGINCDWLLTTGEEIGRSSAELFKTEKDYKWCFSFDRAGTDTVLYQFDHDELRQTLKQFGFQIGYGTFSDLSFIDIGCSGLNMGCGYHDAHGIHAYAVLNETFLQVGRFRALWRAYKDKELPYDAGAVSDGAWMRDSQRSIGYGSYSAYNSCYNYPYGNWQNGAVDKGKDYPDWNSDWDEAMGVSDWEPKRNWKTQPAHWDDTPSEYIPSLEELADMAIENGDNGFDPVG